MSVQDILPYLQLLLTFMNVCILLFAFYKFLNKPKTDMEDRIKICEVKLQEVDQCLKRGNDRFREQDNTNEVMQSCMLALIDFELSFCIHSNYTDTTDLEKAKDKLRNHLARK